MIEELWKDIKDYEGMYKISNIGRVRSVERYVNSYKSKNGKALRKGKIKKQLPNQKGYMRVTLSKNNKSKTHTVHRLVAEHFIDSIENKLCVNHISGIKTDNRVCNLEWCTHQENMIHASNNGLMNSKNLRKPIRVFNESFNKIYNSLTEACKELNLDSRNLGEVARNTGKQKTHRGYKAKYI